MTEVRQLLRLMQPWTGWILLGIFLSLITALANVTLMAISGWFIAAMAIAGLTNVGMNYFTPAAVIRAMAIIRTVGRYAERLITHEATLRLVAQLRRWFYDRIEPLAPAGLQDFQSGDIFSRIGADISTLENFYLRVLVPALVALIAVPLFLIFTGYFSISLALVLLLLYGISGLFIPYLVRHFGKAAAERQVLKAAQMRATLVEGQQALREMLVYGRDQDYRENIENQSLALSKSQRRLSDLQAATQSSMSLAASLAMLAALVTMIPAVQAGVFAGPILPMLMLFAMASFEVIVPLPLAMQAFIETRVAAARLFALADQEPLVKSLDPEEVLEPKPTAPVHVCFRSASLNYPGRDKPAFEAFDLDIKSGEKIAVLGPSGSGKSSLINALMGFWPLSGGQIEINGTSHDRLASEDLRALFAVAPQKPHLFNSTLRGNLLVANQNADEAALEEVLDLVQLLDFVHEQPKGLDSFVGEGGGTLSGGQIRRLSLARALLSPAPVLVLDEPGEGLDPQMEREILKRILECSPQRSMLLITHNSTALDGMDRTYHFQ